MEGGDDEVEVGATGKRRPIVSYLLSFVCDLLLLIFTGYKLQTTQQGVKWKVETTKRAGH